MQGRVEGRGGIDRSRRENAIPPPHWKGSSRGARGKTRRSEKKTHTETPRNRSRKLRDLIEKTCFTQPRRKTSLAECAAKWGGHAKSVIPELRQNTRKTEKKHTEHRTPPNFRFDTGVVRASLAECTAKWGGRAKFSIPESLQNPHESATTYA